MSQQNKLVKTVTDSAVMVGLAAGVGYIAKKMLKNELSWRSKQECYELWKMDCDSGWINGLKNLS